MYINKKRLGQKGGKAVVEKKLRSQIVTCGDTEPI